MMKPKYIIGSVVIIAFIIFAGISLKSSLTPYVPFEEAKKAKSVVQVKGERVIGSEQFDMDSKIFRFRMVDEAGDEFEVIYHGVKPSNFEQAHEVVAIGKYNNGVFEAEQLLVKCPSKYQAEGAQS